MINKFYLSFHLKQNSNSNYSHEKAVFAHSFEDIHFIWFPSIELIEYLKEKFVRSLLLLFNKEYRYTYTCVRILPE